MHHRDECFLDAIADEVISDIDVLHPRVMLGIKSGGYGALIIAIEHGWVVLGKT